VFQFPQVLKPFAAVAVVKLASLASVALVAWRARHLTEQLPTPQRRRNEPRGPVLLQAGTRGWPSWVAVQGCQLELWLLGEALCWETMGLWVWEVHLDLEGGQEDDY